MIRMGLEQVAHSTLTRRSLSGTVRLLVALVLVSSWTTTLAWAQSPSQTTHDLLIEKLDRVYNSLAPVDPARHPITLRLADLYAERGRLAAMKDLDAGCTVCKMGESDRIKALKFYHEAVGKVPPSQRGKVQIQIGHLQQLLGQDKLALDQYQAILSDPNLDYAKADAQLSLAEMHFKQGRFREAAALYESLLANPRATSRGLAAYRLAWSQFNLNQVPQGLEQLKKILTTRELQNKSGLVAGQADAQFLEEVSLDDATWMARLPVGDPEIHEFSKLSPAKVREAHLLTLAAELERTGKMVEAALVWQQVQRTSPDPAVRLEAQVRLVPLLFSERNTEPSLAHLNTALQSWREMKGCGRPDCTELEKILRGFIVNWNQTEKAAPTLSLRLAYESYLQVFPKDSEMAQWGAEVAKKRQEWLQAETLLELATQSLAEKSANDKSGSGYADKLESVLLSRLELAELAKDQATWDKIARSYLDLSPKRTKVHEVRYQQARSQYDRGEYPAARVRLQELASEVTVPTSLRVQAANLDLDTLNLLKDEVAISLQALAYAKMFPGKEALEFKRIHFKSAMNRVAQLAEKNPSEAYASLSAIDVAEGTAEDRKLYLKNKILLAEKTQKFAIASTTTDEYLALTGLTEEEREFGLSKKAWLAELRLDFASALRATQASKTSLKPEQKLLRLALYADLSGGASQNFYQQYLKVGSEPEVKRSIAAQLVRNSSAPLVEIDKHSSLLGADAELLARLYTEVYVKTPDKKVLSRILTDKRIGKTLWGQTLARVQLLQEILPQAKRLQQMNVNASTTKTLGLTIKARATELAKLEKLAQTAVERGDWTAQVTSLSHLATESERFYQEILSLPMPEGLTPEQESEYLSLLTQQAVPFKANADQAKAKTSELWATAGWQQALQKSVDEAGTFRSLAVEEIQALKTVAPQQTVVQLESLQPRDVAQAKPSVAALESARDEVRQSPFDVKAIQRLLQLEKQTGDFAMVQYLEGRLKDQAASAPLQEKTL